MQLKRTEATRIDNVPGKGSYLVQKFLMIITSIHGWSDITTAVAITDCRRNETFRMPTSPVRTLPTQFACSAKLLPAESKFSPLAVLLATSYFRTAGRDGTWGHHHLLKPYLRQYDRIGHQQCCSCQRWMGWWSHSPGFSLYISSLRTDFSFRQRRGAEFGTRSCGRDKEHLTIGISRGSP